MRSKVATSSRRVRSTPETSAAKAGWAGVMVSVAAMVAMETSSRGILALHRAGDELAPVEDVTVDEQVEADRHRDGLLVLDEDQRIQELVPREGEGEDGGGHQPRGRQRQQHPPERGDPPRPVDEGRLL